MHAHTSGQITPSILVGNASRVCGLHRHVQACSCGAMGRKDRGERKMNKRQGGGESGWGRQRYVTSLCSLSVFVYSLPAITTH